MARKRTRKKSTKKRALKKKHRRRRTYRKKKRGGSGKNKKFNLYRRRQLKDKNLFDEWKKSPTFRGDIEAIKASLNRYKSNKEKKNLEIAKKKVKKCPRCKGYGYIKQ